MALRELAKKGGVGSFVGLALLGVAHLVLGPTPRSSTADLFDAGTSGASDSAVAPLRSRTDVDTTHTGAESWKDLVAECDATRKLLKGSTARSRRFPECDGPADASRNLIAREDGGVHLLQVVSNGAESTTTTVHCVDKGGRVRVARIDTEAFMPELSTHQLFVLNKRGHVVHREPADAVGSYFKTAQALLEQFESPGDCSAAATSDEHR